MDELSEKRASDQRTMPIGTVQSVNADGTVNVELDLNNPLAVELFVNGLMFGPEEATRRLMSANN